MLECLMGKYGMSVSGHYIDVSLDSAYIRAHSTLAMLQFGLEAVLDVQSLIPR